MAIFNTENEEFFEEKENLDLIISKKEKINYESSIYKD